MKALPVLFASLLCSATLFAAGTDADFEARMEKIQKEVNVKRGEGKDAFFAYLDVQGRELIRDFPDKADGYQILMAVAQNSEAKKATEIFALLDTPKTPDEIKQAIAGIMAQQEALGKPVAVKFTAIDGRKVDLADLKGKVVLLDFWATWCGPCVAEIPNVKATYAKLHPQGFEIVGISFDQDRSALESFVKSKEMPWPQYFDGKGWENEYGQKYGIRSIPAMWLVDKKGNLVDMQGREELESKVEKLLKD